MNYRGAKTVALVLFTAAIGALIAENAPSRLARFPKADTYLEYVGGTPLSGNVSYILTVQGNFFFSGTYRRTLAPEEMASIRSVVNQNLGGLRAEKGAHLVQPGISSEPLENAWRIRDADAYVYAACTTRPVRRDGEKSSGCVGFTHSMLPILDGLPGRVFKP